MQSSTCNKNPFNEEVGSEPTFIFDNPHDLGTSDSMFHTYSNARYLPVELLLFLRQCFPFSLLYRLYGCHLLGCISLISGILIQNARDRERIHCVCHLFVMRFTGNSLANEKNQTGHSNHDCIFHCMTFLFPTVLLLLFIRVNRTRNFSFSTVMEQYWLDSTIFREFRQTSGKLFICLRRHKPHYLQTQTKNVAQTVYKSVAMLLIHAETSSMILLQWIIFQIHKNKEKTFSDINQRTILVYTEATTITATFAAQLIFRQIIIMSRLKVGKQMAKLSMIQACQGTEAFGIVFMVVVIHATKIHVYAIYNKSNLH